MSGLWMDAKRKTIAVDFDGTLVDHRYPDIGIDGRVTVFGNFGARLPNPTSTTPVERP